ncbi:MAG: hypothetical protein ACOX3T_05690 [Bdellovibrionota bacterium]
MQKFLKAYLASKEAKRKEAKESLVLQKSALLNENEDAILKKHGASFALLLKKPRYLYNLLLNIDYDDIVSLVSSLRKITKNYANEEVEDNIFIEEALNAKNKDEFNTLINEEKERIVVSFFLFINKSINKILDNNNIEANSEKVDKVANSIINVLKNNASIDETLNDIEIISNNNENVKDAILEFIDALSFDNTTYNNRVKEKFFIILNKTTNNDNKNNDNKNNDNKNNDNKNNDNKNNNNNDETNRDKIITSSNKIYKTSSSVENKKTNNNLVLSASLQKQIGQRKEDNNEKINEDINEESKRDETKNNIDNILNEKKEAILNNTLLLKDNLENIAKLYSNKNDSDLIALLNGIKDDIEKFENGFKKLEILEKYNSKYSYQDKTNTQTRKDLNGERVIQNKLNAPNKVRVEDFLATPNESTSFNTNNITTNNLTENIDNNFNLTTHLSDNNRDYNLSNINPSENIKESVALGLDSADYLLSESLSDNSSKSVISDFTNNEIKLIETIFSNVSIENESLIKYINKIKTKNNNKNLRTRNSDIGFDRKLILRNTIETINLLIMFNKLNINLSDDIKKRLVGENVKIDKNNLKDVFNLLYKKRFNRFRKLNKKKAFQKLLKLRIYETRMFLTLLLLQILFCHQDELEEKKNELSEFLISLSPSLKKLIKVNGIFKELLGKLGKDGMKKIIEIKREGEVEEMLEK